MSLETREIFRGEKLSIREIVKRGDSTLKKFFQKLTREQTAGIIALIQRIADNGTPDNPSRFKNEGDQIWAIKDGQIRIYCFFDEGHLIILTNGVIKKSQKADPNALKKARKLREAYRRSRS
ncbi:MAG: type II toxin-antitoxin system RelE/ParE family toxin [Syntrophobacteraceae bacterium]